MYELLQKATGHVKRQKMTGGTFAPNLDQPFRLNAFFFKSSFQMYPFPATPSNQARMIHDEILQEDKESGLVFESGTCWTCRSGRQRHRIVSEPSVYYFSVIPQSGVPTR